MKRLILSILLAGVVGIFSCQNAQNTTPAGNEQSTVVQPKEGGQSTVIDSVSAPDVVKIALSSKDHTTLVKALQAGELVDALSNNGPFTVFAPTNEAFNQLPAGTLDDLLKPEKKADLQNILQYHVFVGVLSTDMMKDGQVLNMVNGVNATLHVKDGKVMINDANVVASIRASNGIVHVIDKVLLPPAKK